MRRSFFQSCGVAVDSTDVKILRIVQENASLPVAEVANRVNLSQTPCWRRIQRLEAAGVIQRRVALLDPDAIGLGLTVFVEIEAADHSPDWLERFATALDDMPEVMEVYRMAGEVDYLLRISIGRMAEYDDIYRRLIAAVPLKNVTSRFAMERVKHTTAYPLIEEKVIKRGRRS
jgi:Lrp/AsnC family transcriptional regulator